MILLFKQQETANFKKITPTKFLSVCIIKITESLILNRTETDEDYGEKSLPQLCLCLSLPTEFMTGEYFDCSNSLKHLTGFQAPGAVSSQSLDSLLLLFQLPKPVCSRIPAASSYACPKKTGYQEVNQHGLISAPPSWDFMGQYNTAGQNCLTSERSTLQMKNDENVTCCLGKATVVPQHTHCT